MTGRKERKKKIQLRLWDSNPQPLAYVDKGTITYAKGEPAVVGHGIKWFLSCGRALREQISTDWNHSSLIWDDG